MANYSANLRLDMGPGTSIEALARAFADINALLTFASAVQSRIDRNDAAYGVLRRREFGPILGDFDLSDGPFRRDIVIGLLTADASPFRSPVFERAIDERLAALADERIVRVTRVMYVNPFDLNISFGGDGIARILETIRDWSAGKREAAARARGAEADADHREADARAAEARAGVYEEELAFKRDLNNEIRRRLAAGDLRVSRGDVDQLLVGHVQRSLESLVRADLGIEIVEDDPTAPDEDDRPRV